MLTFDEGAAPFPAVDTNAMVFMLSKRHLAQKVLWARIQKPQTDAVLDALHLHASDAALVHQRDLSELVATGMSRPPRSNGSSGVPLSAFARVMRGIATGANEFFFLTSDEIRHRGLDKRFFKRAVGRTRDCRKDTIAAEDVEALDKAGRPTWLLRIGKQTKEELPPALRDCIEEGERSGFHERSLIKARRPWYRMEERAVPALLFAYLGRRDCRFIENRAGVVPLTGFLCVYPWDKSKEYRDKLWRALNHPDTIANLLFVGKSYGGGAIKVEPRQLDSLEIPKKVLDEVGLAPAETMAQLTLLETPSRERGKKEHRARR